MKKRKFVRLFAVILLVATCIGCAVVVISPFERKGALGERVIERADHFYTADKVLIVDISGVIALREKRGLVGRKSTVLEVKDVLTKAARDRNIKAIILRISTPGGGVTACDIIYDEIKKFKKRSKKTRGEEVVVIAGLMDMATSGGYYVAQAADKIYALHTTVTGSIGVIAMFPKIKGLADKIGFESRVIKSGKMKDLGSPFRDFTAEETEVIQGVIDSHYERFVSIIAANRTNLSREEIISLADGRIFTSQQALDYGLIDAIAYFDEMIEKTKKIANLDDAEIITYKRPGEYSSNIYSSFRPYNVQQINLLNINLDLLTDSHAPTFMYLWNP